MGDRVYDEVTLPEYEGTGKYRTFQLFGMDIGGVKHYEPVILHVIKTGFKDEYMVVEENAYQDKDHGKIDLIRADRLLEVYGIEI